MAHRRLYKSAISWALAVRSFVKMRNTFPVSIMTRTSRTSFDIGFRREAASRFGRYRSDRSGSRMPAATGPILDDCKGRVALETCDNTTSA